MVTSHLIWNFYRPRLDELWEILGEDKVIYGSDWPNSDTKGSYQQGFNVIQEYVTAKGPVAAEKYFWKNSIRAYHWIKRAPTQPEPNTARDSLGRRICKRHESIALDGSEAYSDTSFSGPVYRPAAWR